MGAGELARAHKVSCFKSLFPIIRRLGGELRRCALTSGFSGYRTMMYMPLGLLFVNVRRPSCTVSAKFSV